MRFAGNSAGGAAKAEAGANGITMTVSHLSRKFIRADEDVSPSGDRVLRLYIKKNCDDEALCRDAQIQVSYRERLSPSYFASCQDDRIIPDKCYNAGTMLAFAARKRPRISAPMMNDLERSLCLFIYI